MVSENNENIENDERIGLINFEGLLVINVSVNFCFFSV